MCAVSAAPAPSLRSFDISAVDASSISAGYANGVLELNLPKKAAKKPEAQRIEIK